MVGAHAALINNNQPHGKNSIKNIRFYTVVNCSSAYWSCALTGSDRSVRPGINKNTPVGAFVYSGWGARIRTMIKRTKISCPTIRRHPKNIAHYSILCPFCNKKPPKRVVYFVTTVITTIHPPRFLILRLQHRPENGHQS